MKDKIKQFKKFLTAKIKALENINDNEYEYNNGYKDAFLELDEKFNEYFKNEIQ